MTRPRTSRLSDPLIALQVVNGHAKRLAQELDAARVAGQAQRVAALRRERAYLYLLKNRAIRVLLDEGRLVARRVDERGLLVEGESPIGLLAFHVPEEQFEAEARRVPREKVWIRDTLVRARAVVSRHSLDDATMLLTRLVTRAQLAARRRRSQGSGAARP